MYVITVSEISIFLLILNNARCSSRQWHGQSRQSYYGYRSLDDQPLMTGNNDSEARTPLRIAWKWPFSQQNRNKVTLKPPSNDKEDESDTLPNDKFIFPDMDIIFDKPKVGPVPKCKGRTFCEDVKEYPTKLVNEAIRNRNLPSYESIDEIDITSRLNDVVTESLCLSTEQIVYPRSAESVDKQWLFIVNHPNFTQGVRIETCMNAGDGCKLVAGFAEGYVTSCEQKFIYRELAAIVEDGSISREHFRFPASCCCHVRFIGTSLRTRTQRSLNNTQNNLNTD